MLQVLSLQMPTNRGHLLQAGHETGDILYLSPLADYSLGQHIRGGVPLVAPWFGCNLGQELQHGWARRIEWEVQETSNGIDARTVHDDWDLRLSVQQRHDGFAMSVRARNTALETRPIQMCFHPYFAVRGVCETTVTGGGKTFTFNGEPFDGVFPVGEYAPFVVDDSTRRIQITAQGSDHYIIWNPGHHSHTQYDDIPAGDWEKFVCVEPALLGHNQQGVLVRHHEWASLGMTVRIQP